MGQTRTQWIWLVFFINNLTRLCKWTFKGVIWIPINFSILIYLWLNSNWNKSKGHYLIDQIDPCNEVPDNHKSMKHRPKAPASIWNPNAHNIQHTHTTHDNVIGYKVLICFIGIIKILGSLACLGPVFIPRVYIPMTSHILNVLSLQKKE